MRPIPFIPESKNFSEFYGNDNSVPEENNEDKSLAYDASDNGKAEEAMFSSVQGEQLLLSLLSALDNKDKIILLYQVLREAGYNLQHEDCAKTLSLSRGGYLVSVKKVKKKCMKILRNAKIV